MKVKMSVSECASVMGCSEQFIRMGLQQKVFPWGYAVKTSKNRWTYYINRQQFMEAIGQG